MANPEEQLAPPIAQEAKDPPALQGPQAPPAPQGPHAPQLPHMPPLNWSHLKPEFPRKPDEDAEAHLLKTDDWMDIHRFQDDNKVQRFCLTLTREDSYGTNF